MTELLTMARDAGFEETAPLHAAQLVFRPEVREMCRADRCSSYGKNWCCPPACPSLEEMTRRMQDYGDGVLVETVGAMSDDFDYEAIMAAEALHKERLRRLTGTLYSRYGRAAVLPMGAGTCRRCASCTCPHAPCRFPEEQVVSMEAYGLLVSQVCQDCGAAYYHGPRTMTYVSWCSCAAAFKRETAPARRPVVPVLLSVGHYRPSPKPSFTICMFIRLSPTRARNRKKPLTEGSFRSL